MRWPSCAVFVHVLGSNLKKSFGLTYIHPYPKHTVQIDVYRVYMLPEMHTQDILLILQVGVVYPCSLYHIQMASYFHSLCKSGSPDDVVCGL